MPDYVLDVDPLDGSVRYLTTDEATDTVRIYKEWETDPLMARNTESYNELDHSARFSKLGDAQVMYHVGTIPPWEMKGLVDKQIITWGGKILDEKALNAYIMDPSFRKIRQVRPLKLGI